MLNRRQFLKLGAAAGVALALPTRWAIDPPSALAYNQSTGLKKFAQPLRGVGPKGIPVAIPDPGPARTTRVTHYTITMQQFPDQLHPSLKPTTLWGYNPTKALGIGGPQGPRHLGGIIIAKKNVPIQVTFRNNLPPKHILPVDRSSLFPDAARFPDNRTSVHLHGAFVPWTSDGGPMAWFDPKGGKGPAFLSNQVLNTGNAINEGEYYYPNQQSARLMWYHDHAHDLTRLNAYAGLASAYIIRDDYEAGLVANAGLPKYIENGGREIPIIIQDKIFVDAATIKTADPTWTGPATTGSLWYPHVYEPDRWEQSGSGALPNPSAIPEMFGDTMLANGTVFPTIAVEPRRYRLRILNACQARFLNLQLYVVNPAAPDGISLNSSFQPTNDKGPEFLVIGTEGGFLPSPVKVDPAVPLVVDNPDTGAYHGGSLLTAPAERWDVIVDFKDFKNKKVVLYTDAPAPFPGGGHDYDFFPGSPNGVAVTPGFGPDTRQILRFDVAASITGAADPSLEVDTGTNLRSGNDPLLVPLGVTDLPPGVPVRRLTLNEDFDSYGRLIQLLGTDQLNPMGMGYGRAYMEHATEVVKAGTTEVWQILNLTMDSHPIHFHLVNCQIISRQPFDMDTFMTTGAVVTTGDAKPPLAYERGWKETVRMNPGEITSVIMKFNLPSVPFQVPFSPNKELGVQGYEYVWHCHILEHEEHDMMRPLVVQP